MMIENQRKREETYERNGTYSRTLLDIVIERGGPTKLATVCTLWGDKKSPFPIEPRG